MRSPVTIPNRKPNEIRYGQIAHITRIDMFQCKSGLIVATFAEGWTASTPAFIFGPGLRASKQIPSCYPSRTTTFSAWRSLLAASF